MSAVAYLLHTSYQSGDDGVEVRVQYRMIWLSQKNMGQLFETSTDNIGLHLKNIFKEVELGMDSVTEDFSVTANELSLATPYV